MNGYALGILISLLVYVVIGNWAGRRVKNLDDFLVAGRQSPTLLIVGTLVASSVSTQQARHLARMALSPTRFCKPAASRSALVKSLGCRPISSPASFSYGDGSNNGFGLADKVGLYAAGPLRAPCGRLC